MRHRLAALLFVTAASLPAQTPLTPHAVHLTNGKSITFRMPAEFAITPAVEGLHRIRFMAKSPDGRIFATDMHDQGDNLLGRIYIFDKLNPKTGRFASVKIYLGQLHNPTNPAFYTDKQGQSWLYVALTEKLVRYKYSAGDDHPEGEPEVLANYPAYGLSYKYGGWHLTRTIVFAPLHGRTMLYVAVGSSCNACNEKEDIRATLSVMNPDGSDARIVAKGLRNAVGLAYIPEIDGGALFASNMGADHLGDEDPEDTFFELDANTNWGPIAFADKTLAVGDKKLSPPANYGWPTCYFSHGQPKADHLISDPKPTDIISPRPPAGPPPPQFDCTQVPAAYTTFPPHGSPLGFDYFGDDAPASVRDSFLVALHGATFPQLHGTRGYRLVRVSTKDRKPEDFMTGFVADKAGKVIVGRPCGILKLAPNAFLLTDDHTGVVYYIHAKPESFLLFRNATVESAFTGANRIHSPVRTASAAGISDKITS